MIAVTMTTKIKIYHFSVVSIVITPNEKHYFALQCHIFGILIVPSLNAPATEQNSTFIIVFYLQIIPSFRPFHKGYRNSFEPRLREK